jgi:uncharacterized protein (UPF0332 family)
MRGRAFLEAAKHAISAGIEAAWRTAAGRAYYALMSEARVLLARWGIVPKPRDPVHSFVRLRLLYAADPIIKDVGRVLDSLSQLRTDADYRLERSGKFATDKNAKTAIWESENAIKELDHIDGDPTRRAAAIADIRARWP